MSRGPLATAIMDEDEASAEDDKAPSSEPGEEISPGLEAAAEECLEAFKAGDARALASAMKSFYAMC